jgi:hypothetical protein
VLGSCVDLVLAVSNHPGSGVKNSKKAQMRQGGVGESSRKLEFVGNLLLIPTNDYAKSPVEMGDHTGQGILARKSRSGFWKRDQALGSTNYYKERIP